MVAIALKLISFLLIGLFVTIFPIPQVSLHKTEAFLGLMTPRSVVSRSFSSGKALFRLNELAGFGNFWDRSQGSFLSYSRRFLVIPKARSIISEPFKTLSLNPRDLEAKTINFGFLAPKFRRSHVYCYVLAPALDGFNIENYFAWHDCSMRYGAPIKPSFVQFRSPVLAISRLECPHRLYYTRLPSLRPHMDTFRQSVLVRFPAGSLPFRHAWVRFSAGSTPALGQSSCHHRHISSPLILPSARRLRSRALRFLSAEFGPSTTVCMDLEPWKSVVCSSEYPIGHRQSRQVFPNSVIFSVLDCLPRISEDPESATKAIGFLQCLAPQNADWTTGISFGTKTLEPKTLIKPWNLEFSNVKVVNLRRHFASGSLRRQSTWGIGGAVMPFPCLRCSRFHFPSTQSGLAWLGQCAARAGWSPPGQWPSWRQPPAQWAGL
jgi:hypothetical protein